MKKILILSGGFSKERAISLDTAKSVLKALRKKSYKAIICEPDGKLINKIKRFKPNVVFNALHGRFGEDGYIQTILETIGVKYTHSGVVASYIAMDKEISKKLFLKNKILTPKYLKYKFYKGIIKKTKLIFNIKKILKFAIFKGGSSVRDFQNTLGKSGNFQQFFKVYGQKNKNCSRISCKGKIKKITISNRSSFYCSRCQI